ncbi:MAG TPA: flavodoxin [Bacteroidales bacterium]|nr:flavodoxin [Bacteroidales bacterium]
MNTEVIKYIGCDDADLDLFESQYALPAGMCYNSYLLLSEKVTIMDTVDPRKTDEWLNKLTAALNGRKPEYLIIQHMEPDHSGSINAFLTTYPNTTLVGSKIALQMLPQFGINATNTKEVKGGDTLDLGGMTLSFIAAPMVHWPEVLMTYVPEQKVLFSADGFGKFGMYDADPDDWACEARRYYFNICGKYGRPVANVLKAASMLDIQTIAPLHGPILEGEKMQEAVRLYTIWSSYQPETDGVLVAYASIHGNTRKAALQLAEILKQKGAKKVAVTDLSRDDMAEAVEDAFRMSRMAVCCSTYDADIFPPMHNFLHKLQLKTYQSRRVGLVENGSWAPQAARIMRSMLEQMKDITIVEPIVSIRSTLKPTDMPALEALAEHLLQD